MGELILVTGGARSGKSLFAELLAKKASDGCDKNDSDEKRRANREDDRKVIYVATAIAADDEMKRRIFIHRERRPSDWMTLELPLGISHSAEIMQLMRLSDRTATDVTVLIDCITVMITNMMLASLADWDNARISDIQRVEAGVSQEIDSIIAFSRSIMGKVIVVSNEVGMGLVPTYPLGRAFRDIAGRANQKIAENSDAVYLCVSGIPIKIKEL